MGRTNPTYRDALRGVESEWQPFRRALRRQYRADFDRLFERARAHADAAGYANATDPELAFLLSVLLSQEAELRELRAAVAAETDALDDGGGPDPPGSRSRG